VIISCSEIEGYEVWHMRLGIQLKCLIKKKKNTGTYQDRDLFSSVEEYMNGFINIGL
jgi:hypothetical protein